MPGMVQGLAAPRRRQAGGGRPRLRGLGALAVLVGGLVGAAPSSASADAPPGSPPGAAAPSPTGPAGTGATDRAVSEALERLGSPFLAEREQAVLDLVRWLPTSRDAVLAAFGAADSVRRPLLVRVLAADGTKPSLDALLRAFPTATEAATVSAIELSLVEHAEAVGAAVASWRDPSGRVPPRIAELASLLERARIEGLFLSRKSKSGGTGSYPGQFEVLRPDRKEAMEICLAVLSDRAFKLPGTFLPTGAYRWLRPPPFVVERFELRHMAVNAIAELATPEDAGVIERLEAYHETLRLEIDVMEERADAQGRRVRVFGAVAVVEKSLLDAVLATLARLRPKPWKDLATERISELEGSYFTLDDAAAMALRLGDYARAEALYRNLMRQGERALASYNLACAYARWALDIERGGAQRDRRSPSALKAQALLALEMAVDAGYPDWEWMVQDRDLDAVKDSPKFAELVERMKTMFRLPPRDPAGPRETPEPAGMER